MADYFERVLTDAWESFSREDYELTSDNFLGYEGPPWRIRKFTLKGGKQQGVELVEVDNGELTFVVVPTRGMSILEAFTDDVSLGWSSPVRQVVHPAYIQPEARGGLGWLSGFNEFVCRCGLAYNGAPGEDVIRTNTGAEARANLPLHGSIANTPAVRISVRVQLTPPYELSVCGEVRDATMFGPVFEMTSVVSTLPGARQFAIRDTVANASAMPTEMELLYHCNYGAPLLGEGSQIVAPVEFVCPRDARAAEGMTTWSSYGPPEAGFAEQCYFLRLHSDRDGRTVVGLTSPDQRAAATIRFSVKELPAFTIWRNSAAEHDGYVTGLEPGTDYPNNRMFERGRGRVIELPPEARYETGLVFSLLRGDAELSALRTEVAKISEGKQTEVCDDPHPDYCPE
jgi:hypothetical protein